MTKNDAVEDLRKVPKCPNPKESYTFCGWSCPDTCENYGTRRKCKSNCVKGCVCYDGYVRDSRNSNPRCILPEECTDPPVCDRPGEEYSECGSKDSCQLTCNNLDDPPSYWCDIFCRKGCFCKNGYARDDNWNCIPVEKCPKKIGPGYNCSQPNEYYNSCGSACPPTCENYGKNLNCPKVCVQGCFCKEGYVRDFQNLCIKPVYCSNPTVCLGAGEDFEECGSQCPLTCDNYENPPKCSSICKSGCFCRKGLVRNDEQECVLPTSCNMIENPTVCSTGEVLDECGCETKCTGIQGQYVRQCPPRCTKSCACKKGLARHPIDGTCIRKRSCPNVHQTSKNAILS
ncbi:tenascin-like [Centruroides vittatus]|uniref:tenascin-like n=1 Tax=Centruroides vittatus TaxID=120091 RepID=UPI0035102F85